ncbi:hypothetical protein ['Camptotheca acuminata' phytoplasma]|uniref:hypothetical protein n=1 Tax='Camptotheca acuminata' phytoplasma TaxID=3239192 RepID=UPI00351AA65F
MLLMNSFKKIFLLLKEKTLFYFSKENKYFCILLFSLAFILISLSLLFNINREFYKNRADHSIKPSEIEKIHDAEPEEQNLIGFKSMFIGIIFFIALFVYKKGFIGMSIGFFVGAVVGIWLFISYPFFIYFLELIFRIIFRLK